MAIWQKVGLDASLDLVFEKVIPNAIGSDYNNVILLYYLLFIVAFQRELGDVVLADLVRTVKVMLLALGSVYLNQLSIFWPQNHES